LRQEAPGLLEPGGNSKQMIAELMPETSVKLSVGLALIANHGKQIPKCVPENTFDELG